MGGMADPQLQALLAQTGAVKALLLGEVTDFVRNYSQSDAREKIICRIFKSRFSDKEIGCWWLLMQNVNKPKLSFLTKKNPHNKKKPNKTQANK